MSEPVKIVDLNAQEWKEHPRFAGILACKLLTSADNPHANLNAVRVPPGGVIGFHTHAAQIETVFVLAGQSELEIDGVAYPFNAGNAAALPVGKGHMLRNTGSEDVQLLTFFTPPLS